MCSLARAGINDSAVGTSVALEACALSSAEVTGSAVAAWHITRIPSGTKLAAFISYQGCSVGIAVQRGSDITVCSGACGVVVARLAGFCGACSVPSTMPSCAIVQRVRAVGLISCQCVRIIARWASLYEQWKVSAAR